MSNGPIDEEGMTNFNLGVLFGRYCAWSSVIYFIELAKAKISPEAKEIIKKEEEKWEWMWCESNKRGEPLPVSAWEKRDD